MVFKLLRDADRDLAQLQARSKTQRDDWDIGVVRARLVRVRELLAGSPANSAPGENLKKN